MIFCMNRLSLFVVMLGVFVNITAVGNAGSKKIPLGKVNAATDLMQWSTDFGKKVKALRLASGYPQLGYLECKKTTEVNDTVLCFHNNQEEMGFTLARASCFIEGSFCDHKKGHILSFSDQGFNRAVGQINGYDLTGKDLMHFYNSVKKKCSESRVEEGFCFNDAEKMMFEGLILPMASSNPNFVLITFARLSRSPWPGVVTHEVLHAQYFTDPTYRNVVDGFWNEIPEKEREDIRNALSVAYDKNDEFLMKNEFQAYILEPNTGKSSSILAIFVNKYREKLLSRLASAKREPVQVKISQKKVKFPGF